MRRPLLTELDGFLVGRFYKQFAPNGANACCKEIHVKHRRCVLFVERKGIKHVSSVGATRFVRRIHQQVTPDGA